MARRKRSIGPPPKSVCASTASTSSRASGRPRPKARAHARQAPGGPRLRIALGPQRSFPGCPAALRDGDRAAVRAGRAFDWRRAEDVDELVLPVRDELVEDQVLMVEDAVLRLQLGVDR